LQAIKQVALQLGNTPAVCRKCYIHPSVLDRYLDGALQLNQTIMRKDEAIDKNEAVGMWAVERQLIRFLNAERHAANSRSSLEASLKASVRAARTKGLPSHASQ
jgi:DNA topoisomerase-1